MGWIFSLLPFLVFAFIAISVIRNAMKVMRKMNEQAQGRQPPAQFDPTESERTRRIQEEIRRKIAERRGRSTATQQPSRVEPVFPSHEEPSVTVEEPPQLVSNAAVLERQRQLAEQMRELEVARQQQVRKAANLIEADAIGTAAASSAAKRDEILGDLRDPATARRAILLREILGVPVGLR